MREWVASLTVPLPEAYADRAACLRRLVVDLWANGCRRVRQRQYEDAILRAYRVLELLGQIRLFDHGLDSASLPPDHPAVAKLQENLQKTKSAALSRGPNGTLLAGGSLVESPRGPPRQGTNGPGQLRGRQTLCSQPECTHPWFPGRPSRHPPTTGRPLRPAGTPDPKRWPCRRRGQPSKRQVPRFLCTTD